MLEVDPQMSLMAAFGAGMVTSLHCVGMCGPMACAFTPASNSMSDTVVPVAVYHTLRVFAYILIGAIAGAIGQAPMVLFAASPVAFLPWALVLFFVAVALRLDRYLPKPKFVSRWLFRLKLKASSWPKPLTAGLIGFLTPLLPCGPLYAVFGVCLFTGSAVAGAELMAAFGLGTLPLLFAVQTQFANLRKWLSPRWLGRAQTTFALVAALMIGLRLLQYPVLAAQDATPEDLETARQQGPDCPIHTGSPQGDSIDEPISSHEITLPDGLVAPIPGAELCTGSTPPGTKTPGTIDCFLCPDEDSAKPSKGKK